MSQRESNLGEPLEGDPMRSAQRRRKRIGCRDRVVFENPAAECDVRISIRIGEEAWRQGNQQRIRGRGDEPRHDELCIHNPSRLANDLIGHPTP